MSVINTQLIQRLQVVEEDQLLNGSGVAPNMVGLLNGSGIQTYGATGDLASLNLDKIYHGLTLVETGTSLMPPDGIIIHRPTMSVFALPRTITTSTTLADLSLVLMAAVISAETSTFGV